MNRGKRFFALLLSLALLAAPVLPALAADDSFSIKTVEDFVEFSRLCTRDTWSVGKTVELNADLDLSGVSDFVPIPVFQGTFHGNGHTISGFSFSQKGSKEGLFRTLTQSAMVEHVTVNGTMAPQGTACSIGLLAGENYGTIQNCTACGSVSGQEDVGGLVGINGESGRLLSCSNTADVTAVTNSGGLAGQNLGLIETSTNSGAINIQPDQDTPTNVGGIAGLSRGTIRDCTNSGQVGYQHVGYNLGGIAGLQSGELNRCVNTGSIQGRKDVGGIVGQFEPNTSLTYGASPTQALSESLGGLLDELQTLTDTLDAMAGRSVEDVQIIHDALSAIQNRAYAAGSQGQDDFQSMSQDLYQYTTQISTSLDHLRSSASQINDQATQQLQTALDQSDQLLQSLRQLASQADSGIQDAAKILEQTLSSAQAQLQIILSHRQGMEQELQGLLDYIAQVSQLVASGQFDQALQLPFPTLDLNSHLQAISSALDELSRLTAKLPGQWADLYRRVSNSMKETGDEMDRQLSRLHDALNSLLQLEKQFSQSASQDLDAISQDADRIRDLLKEYTDTLSEQAQSAVDDIDAQLTTIQNQVDQMTQGASDDRLALHRSSQAMLQHLEDARQAISELGTKPELTITDLTDQVEEGPGLIMACTSNSAVSGDTNVGGIVGAVAPELGDDPEATFDLGNLELMSDVYATLRAVVRNCRFDGTVTAKNECAGGIAGRCEAGAILDCGARGNVDTSGSYCAGIAGRTRGTVERCAALVDLSGESWLGGITGLGKDIRDCRSMVRVDSEGEYLGAIAGQSEGELAGNFYLLEDLAGLDGVDCAGLAEGVDFFAFAQLDYVPEDFLTFSYRFEVEGQILAEIPFSYGENLNMSQVPQAPERNGQYGQWPSFPTQNLRRSLTIQAQFSSPTSTLADQEGIPRLLVEGAFSPDAALTVQQTDPPGRDALDAEVVGVWAYTVTGSQEDTVTLRLRTDGAAHPAAAIYENGVWTQVETTLDGSYLVLIAPTQGQVALLDTGSVLPWMVALGIGTAVLLLAGGWILHRRRHPIVPAQKIH